MGIVRQRKAKVAFGLAEVFCLCHTAQHVDVHRALQRGTARIIQQL
ncbi:hypothetical protein SDC9_194903 [bioreactor metagenome]|uniref:Uncharacterized protein n=1 Tax=bioreactor metagenome TaxID=1076179 RepID=A0A645I7K4_9ZZZZ